MVHHTVTRNDYTTEEAPSLVRSIYAYHTKTLNWCDIGYQFLVDRYGTIYEGRYGSMAHAVQGAQSAGFNAQTFGVSILGTFSETQAPAPAMTSVDQVIQWQLGLDRVDPTGSTTFVSAGNTKHPEGTRVTLSNVMGHRDNGSTSCPGDALYAQLPELRRPLPANPGPRRPPLVNPPTAPSVQRIGEADRYATSARVSERTFPEEVPVAYIASGHDFPDALAGAPAAAHLDGPLLLTGPASLPDPIRAELERLKPARIVALGGASVVGPGVLDQLKAYTDGPVSRLGGKNRYETAARISADTYESEVPVAYITSGRDFADALSGSPAAAAQDGPMLLTAPNAIPETTGAELARLRPERIVVLGGAGAVHDSVVTSLQRFTAGTVTRLGGKDRYETSAQISAAAFTPAAPVAYLASGRDFPDALSGGPAASRGPGPMLLTGVDQVPDVVVAELKRLRPERIVVLGGTGAVSSAVMEQLQALRWP